MTTQSDISGLTPDDLQFAVSLSYQGSPLNLATVQAVTAYLKQDATYPDTGAKTYTIGSGLTVTNSAQGQLTWLIPHADTPGNGWYRFEVTDAESHLSTALMGRLNQTDA